MPPKSAKAKASGPRCVGRTCGEKFAYPGAPSTAFARLREEQCDKLCEDPESDLCVRCKGREEANLISGKVTYHGKIGGPIPEGSHIEGSAKNIAGRAADAKKAVVASEKAASLAAEAAGGSAAPASVKAPAKETKKLAVVAKKAVEKAATATKVAERAEAVAVKAVAAVVVKARKTVKAAVNAGTQTNARRSSSRRHSRGRGMVRNTRGRFRQIMYNRASQYGPYVSPSSSSSRSRSKRSYRSSSRRSTRKHVSPASFRSSSSRRSARRYVSPASEPLMGNPLRGLVPVPSSSNATPDLE